jgi:hypothetical protein
VRRLARPNASNIGSLVSELQACRSSWVFIEPTRIAILRCGIRRPLPPILPRLHYPGLKPRPLAVHVEVARSNHVLPLEMQRNCTRRALLVFAVNERGSTARAMIERRSFGCHEASPGLILQADILAIVVFPANEVTCFPGMTKLHSHMDTRKLAQSKPNEERMRIRATYGMRI